MTAGCLFCLFFFSKVNFCFVQKLRDAHNFPESTSAYLWGVRIKMITGLIYVPENVQIVHRLVTAKVT